MYKKSVEAYDRKETGLLIEVTSTDTGLAITIMENMHRSEFKAYVWSTVSTIGGEIFTKKIFDAVVVRSQKPLTVELVDEVEEVAKKKVL